MIHHQSPPNSLSNVDIDCILALKYPAANSKSNTGYLYYNAYAINK